jgi:RNA polymerase sigma-70 factor, ECF subfamily
MSCARSSSCGYRRRDEADRIRSEANLIKCGRFELLGASEQPTGKREIVPATAQSIYEETLVVRSQLGDESASRELLRLYSPRLLGFTRKMLAGSTECAEDLLQEVWIAIFRGLPSLLDVTKFRAWAFRIARDRIYREFRRRKLPVDSMQEVDLSDVPVESETVSAFDAEELHRCLDSLSTGHREVLMLRYFEAMNYEEIARVTNSGVGTVRSRIHYAKRALRRAVDQTLYEPKPR